MVIFVYTLFRSYSKKILRPKRGTFVSKNWTYDYGNMRLILSFLLGYLLVFLAARSVGKTPFVDNPILIKLAFQKSALLVTILLTLSKSILTIATYTGLFVFFTKKKFSMIFLFMFATVVIDFFCTGSRGTVIGSLLLPFIVVMSHVRNKSYLFLLSIVGGVGVLLLTILDTVRYKGLVRLILEYLVMSMKAS